MINIKKGNGLTLQQVDKAFALQSSLADVKAGMAVASTAGGLVGPSGSAAYGSTYTYVVGVALSDSTSGDVKESGKLPVLLLDGGVIETDQILTAASAGWASVGMPVYAYSAGTTAGSLGKFTTDSSNNSLVGYLMGTRTLPIARSSDSEVSQTWTNVAGTSVTTTSVKPGFQTATFAEIKLISTGAVAVGA
jgi:hypothetical protein